MNPAVKWGMLGFLVAIATAYFAFIAVKARPLAAVLLHRGWGDRGWTEGRLTGMLRALGAVGFIVGLVGLGLCASRLMG